MPFYGGKAAKTLIANTPYRFYGFAMPKTPLPPVREGQAAGVFRF